MRISIIVPVYNVEEYLDECVQSLVDQTYRDLEILLIDDGSTDNSGAICDKWAAADERIRVIHQENRGVSYTRNLGIETAGGEVLYFMDSDDYISTEMCEKTMEVLVRENADMVIFGGYRFGMGTDFKAKGKLYEGHLPRETVLREMLHGELSDGTPFRICRKELFDGVRFPLNQRFEDVATMYKLYLKTDRIYALPERLYYYRKREGSVVTDLPDEALRDRVLARYRRYLDLRELYPEIAEEAIPLIASSGLQYYHRSLWHPVDEELVAMIKAFYRENRRVIRKTARNNNVKYYSLCPTLYILWRRARNRLIVLKKKRKK